MPGGRWPHGSPTFFAYGDAAVEAERLGLLSGMLLLDGGEADRTFLLRCQHRFVTYAWLLGLRPILLIEDLAQHEALLDALQVLQDDCSAMMRATGLRGLFQFRSPIILGCDLDDLSVRAVGDLPILAGAAGYYLNQTSPSAVTLLGRIDAILGARGVRTGLDLAQARADGECALKFHDKILAGSIARLSPPPAPPHLPTAIIKPSDLAAMPDWDTLVRWYRGATGEPAADAFMIKSSCDSAGNLAASVRATTFAVARARLLDAIAAAGGHQEKAAITALRAEIAISRLEPERYSDTRLQHFEAMRRERRAGLELLVQRYVPPAAPDPVLPPALGLSYHIDANKVSAIAVSAQTYHDQDRRHFRGALLDDRIEAAIARGPLQRQMLELCRHFARSGYRGPIGFDALRERDDYVLIDDCNPRLSAVMPALAVRRALAAVGRRPSALLSLGYRGETIMPDFVATIAALDRAELLYTRTRRAGLLPLPNMAQMNGTDVFVIDATPAILDRANPVLAAMGCQNGFSSAIPGLTV